MCACPDVADGKPLEGGDDDQCRRLGGQVAILGWLVAAGWMIGGAALPGVVTTAVPCWLVEQLPSNCQRNRNRTGTAPEELPGSRHRLNV